VCPDGSGRAGPDLYGSDNRVGGEVGHPWGSSGWVGLDISPGAVVGCQLLERMGGQGQLVHVCGACSRGQLLVFLCVCS
jgi:hypothetical protein